MNKKHTYLYMIKEIFDGQYFEYFEPKYCANYSSCISIESINGSFYAFNPKLYYRYLNNTIEVVILGKDWDSKNSSFTLIIENKDETLTNFRDIVSECIRQDAYCFIKMENERYFIYEGIRRISNIVIQSIFIDATPRKTSF